LSNSKLRVALILSLLVGNTLASKEGPALGLRLSVKWGAVGPRADGETFRSILTLVNRGASPLPGRGWTLYFNLPQPILSETTATSVRLTRINGDFHKLEPTDAFPAVDPGQSVAIPLVTPRAIVNASGAPSGFYLVEDSEGAPPTRAVESVTIEPFLKPEQTIRGAKDRMPATTPALRFAQNTGLAPLSPGRYGPVTPTPVRLIPRPGRLALTPATEIHFGPGLSAEAQLLATSLRPLIGHEPRVVASAGVGTDAILLTVGAVLVDGRSAAAGDSAYRLTIDPRRGIAITGTDPAGVFYGIQTLRALVAPEAYASPQPRLILDAVAIEDAPRFHYRGLLLDVARHFQPKQGVLKLLELMAFYKLNTLHLHLADDEGWRIAIDGLPELIDVGGRRGHTLDERDHLVPSFGSGPDPDTEPGSGHYTRADFVEILREARLRHIDVIPEIDVPGHARAAIVAMRARHARFSRSGTPEEAGRYLLTDPEDRSSFRSVQGWTDNVIDVCQPSTYAFLRKVIAEVAALYAEAGVPFEVFHVGGDEVPAGAWLRSPACNRLLGAGSDEARTAARLRDHFLHQLNGILAERGVVSAGWEEIAFTETHADGKTIKEPNPAFLASRVRPYVWNNVWGEGAEDHAYKLANAGYDIVMAHAANLYFDLAYDKDPDEPGQDWAGFVDTRSAYEFAPFNLYSTARSDLMGNPIEAQTAFARRVRATQAGRKHILGLQGCLWGENAKGAALMEYLLFPKLLGLAERAWAKEPVWEEVSEALRREPLLAADWNDFANRIGQRELVRLSFLAGGVGYRVPAPGAVVENGVLSANVAFPGLTIRYTTDGSEPTATAAAYVGPTAVGGRVKLKAFVASGHSSRTAVVGP
jgi:hexosaminidase